MSIWDVLLAGQTLPFAAALGVVFGLSLLEVTTLALSGALLGAERGAAQDGAVVVDLEVELRGVDLDAAPPDAPKRGAIAAAFDWLGLGASRFTIWLGVFLLAFGALGVALQWLVALLFGAPVHWAALLAPAVLAGGAAARRLATRLSRALPQVDPGASHRAVLGGRVGVVVGAVGGRGRPTEVRVLAPNDRIRHLRAEPLNSDAALEPGDHVVVLRREIDGVFRAIALEEARAAAV